MQVPDRLPDNEVFGKNDTTEADVIARREHARKIASEQVKTVADRKRAEILKQLQEQQEEEEMLKRNKSEYVPDNSTSQTCCNLLVFSSSWLGIKLYHHLKAKISPYVGICTL